ncbi:MAG: response regulator [Thermoanaerobaculia bacterium]
MTRVMVVDDHPIVREGLVAALDGKGGIEIAGAFGSAEEAIASITRLKPEVVVLDLELPGMSGLDAIVRLRDHAAIVVLTAYESEEDIERALGSGAKGYLLKGAPLDDIERAIAAASRGESFVDARLAGRMMSRRGGERLTPREREVLRLVADGLSNKEIGVRLNITERTAKFHVTAILNKLGAENRAQAVAVAKERRLI